MIGRAAVDNPWIFSRMDRKDVPKEQVQATLHAHLERNLAMYGAERGLVLFRKYAKGYLEPYNPARAAMLTLLTTGDVKVFSATADAILQA